jgi:hypothetical protein
VKLKITCEVEVLVNPKDQDKVSAMGHVHYERSLAHAIQCYLGEAPGVLGRESTIGVGVKVIEPVSVYLITA